MLEHKNNLLKIPGSKLLWGGEELENHSIPKVYGAIKPTAVFVPLDQILKAEHYDLVTKEIFGPFQVSLTSLFQSHIQTTQQDFIMCTTFNFFLVF